MAAGLNANLTLGIVNQQAGTLCAQLQSLFRQIDEFQAFLLATDLTQAPILMGSTDQATVKSAFTDLEQLFQIYSGNQILGSAKNFTTFAKQLWGTTQ